MQHLARTVDNRISADQLVIRDINSLARARGLRDQASITIETQLLKHRNLMPAALKYALWAVVPGGTIVVEDDGHGDPSPHGNVVSSNMVRQWIGRFIGKDVDWFSEGVDGPIVLRRTRPVPGDGWSAGVVFSGQDSEIPALQKCLAGLLAQPELQHRNGQPQVHVSGPARDLSFLGGDPRVAYLEFPAPDGGRFMIGQKKNALMRAMAGPRMVVLHARIVLDKGALTAVPREFDMSSPNTAVLRDGAREAYLSLAQADSVWPAVVPKRATVMFRALPRPEPLLLHELGGVFVDGGAFYVTKELFEACPLNNHIAWNEGEDVEWCGRAFGQGFLIDMAPESHALSQTSKLAQLPRYGRLTAPVLSARLFARDTLNSAIATADRLLRRR